MSNKNAKDAKKANKLRAEMELSKDGEVVAASLMAAMLYGSGSLWSGSPVLQFTYKNPDKSFLAQWYNFTATYYNNSLTVRHSNPFKPAFDTRDPQAAVEFMKRSSGGYIVSASVRCKSGVNVAGVSVGGGQQRCADVTFWNIRFESRRANTKPSNTKPANNARIAANQAAKKIANQKK